MPNTQWYEKLGSITQYVFEISTPGGRGTGFQIFVNSEGFCGVATALHVIDHALEWDEPIKIIHHQSGRSLVLKAGDDRAILPHPDQDLAFIFFHKKTLPIKDSPASLIEPQTNIVQGVEMGWLGFPSVAPPHGMCFFAGHVSAYLKAIGSYLVDGVVINGVSGGPAFFIDESSNEIKVCGVITAYMPNRAYGDSLPGLSIVRDVEPYREELERLKSIPEAEKTKTEESKRTEENVCAEKAAPEENKIKKPKQSKK